MLPKRRNWSTNKELVYQGKSIGEGEEGKTHKKYIGARLIACRA